MSNKTKQVTVLSMVRPGGENHSYGWDLIGQEVSLARETQGVNAGDKVIVKDIDLSPGCYVVTAMKQDGKTTWFAASDLLYSVPEEASPCYAVLSIRQLLELLTEAQKPSSDGRTDVAVSNCVVLQGSARTTQDGRLQFNLSSFRRA